MRAWPLFALCMCAGIAVQDYMSASARIGIAAAAAVLGIAFFVRRRHGALMICAGIFWAACGMATEAVSLLDPERDAFAYRLSNACAIDGYAESDISYSGNAARFRFRAVSAACAGRTFLLNETIDVESAEALPVVCAERLVLRGDVREAPRRGVRGRRRGQLTLLIPSSAFLRREGAAVRLPFSAQAQRLRLVLCGLVREYVRGVPGDILAGMLVGDKALIPPLVIRDMVRTGTIHLLIVSGSHVGIVAAGVLFLLRLLRFPRRLRFCAAVPCLAMYAAVTGNSAPVVRAAIMAGVFLTAYPLKREPDIHNAWAVAMIALLFADPEQLYNLGFQLSFVSVMAIIYVYPRMKSLCRVESVNPGALRRVLDAGILSAAVWISTAGIIAAGCGIFSPVTVIANLALVPLAGIITVGGFAVVMAGLIWPGAAAYMGTGCEALLLVMLKLNALFLKIPCAYFSW